MASRKRRTEYEIRTKDSTSAPVKKINRSFDSLLVSTRAIEGPLGGVAGRLTAINAGLGSVGPRLLLFGAAIGGLTAALVKAVKISVDFEQQQLKIDALLRATGQSAGFTTQELIDMADALDQATLASSKGAQEAAASLLSFSNITEDRFRRTLSIAQDMTAVFGTDLRANIQTLGRALSDPVKGLDLLARRFTTLRGPVGDAIKALGEAGDVMGAQTLILDELQSKIGGTGAGEAGGIIGAWDLLSFQAVRLGRNLGADSILMIGLEGLISAHARLLGLAADLAAGPSLEEQIEKQIEAIEKLRDASGSAGTSNLLGAELDQDEIGKAEMQLALLLDRQDAELAGLALADQRAEQAQEERDATSASIRLKKEEAELAKKFKKEEATAIALFDKESLAAEDDRLKLLERGRKARESLLNSLNREVALLGKGREAALAYDLSLQKAGLTAEQFDVLLDEASGLAKQIDEFEKAQEEAEKLEGIAQDLGFTFTSAFEDAVIAGEDLSKVLQGLGDDIARIILRETVTTPLAGLVSSGISSVFGGLFTAQHGIDFTVGGSGGPDSQLIAGLVSPGERVTVTPAGQTPPGGGGVTLNQNNEMHISGNDSSMEFRLQVAMQQASAAAVAQIKGEMRRGGEMAHLSRGR